MEPLITARAPSSSCSVNHAGCTYTLSLRVVGKGELNAIMYETTHKHERLDGTACQRHLAMQPASQWLHSRNLPVALVDQLFATVHHLHQLAVSQPDSKVLQVYKLEVCLEAVVSVSAESEDAARALATNISDALLDRGVPGVELNAAGVGSTRIVQIDGKDVDGKKVIQTGPLKTL